MAESSHEAERNRWVGTGASRTGWTGRTRPPDTVTWDVGPVVVGEEDGWHTWSCALDGDPLRFSLLGLRPSERVEAALTFAGPLALAEGADLRPAGPVDPGWRAGFSRALDVMRPWMGGDRAPQLLDVHEAATPAPATGRTAMCFTGGVDSFWTVLRGGYPVTDLVYVLGYDYGLGDPELVATQVGTVNEVAAELGLRLLLVSTDARRHPRARPALWGLHHGAALAAVAILLSDHVDRLVVPASYPEGGLIPWGSRPDLDHLWSVPGVVAVEHGPSTQARIDRVLDIAHEPLVQRHLAVCWEREGPEVNCGSCEKCVRTMVALAAAGVLDRVRTFPPVDLPAAVAALHPLPRTAFPFWRQLVDDRVPAALRDAARGLLRASGDDGD